MGIANPLLYFLENGFSTHSFLFVQSSHSPFKKNILTVTSKHENDLVTESLKLINGQSNVSKGSSLQKCMQTRFNGHCDYTAFLSK